MYGRELGLACVILFACGPSAPPPKAASAPLPEPAPIALLEAPDAETAAVEVYGAESAYDTNPCEGTDLDLGSLAAQGMCNLDRTAGSLPAGLVASLTSDSYQVVQGQETEVRMMLSNTTASPMVLELDASCRFLNVVELALYRKGDRVDRIDRVGSGCDVDAKVDCSGHVIGVTLAAGGQAFISVTARAQISLLAKVCKEFPGRALSPGDYLLKLRTAFATEPLTAAFKVSRLVRLARERCRSYASRVANLAEPDIALRAGVSDALTAQCQRQPPIKEFADCQLAANTAQELEDCGEAE